jgi:predicted nucleotidyltransferase component of viral defense system
LLKGKGILSNGQKQLLVDLSKIQSIDKFYLTGGTALSEFYLAHRKSYDLDLFTSHREIVQPISRIIEDTLKKTYNVRVVKRFETNVIFEIDVNSENVN